MGEGLGTEAGPFYRNFIVAEEDQAPLDKQPGVCPVGIGEIYRRLWAKCILNAIGTQATVACDNFNLCAGLPAGIDGAVHAIWRVWEDPPTTPTAQPAPTPAPDPRLKGEFLDMDVGSSDGAGCPPPQTGEGNGTPIPSP